MDVCREPGDPESNCPSFLIVSVGKPGGSTKGEDDSDLSSPSEIMKRIPQYPWTTILWCLREDGIPKASAYDMEVVLSAVDEYGPPVNTLIKAKFLHYSGVAFYILDMALKAGVIKPAIVCGKDTYYHTSDSRVLRKFHDEHRQKKDDARKAKRERHSQLQKAARQARLAKGK